MVRCLRVGVRDEAYDSPARHGSVGRSAGKAVFGIFSNDAIRIISVDPVPRTLETTLFWLVSRAPASALPRWDVGEPEWSATRRQIGPPTV